MTRAGRGERLRPEDRLRKKSEFDRAYSFGARIPSRSFTLIVLPSPAKRTRLGVTLAKGVGGAVVRNAIRRRLREAFRRNRGAVAEPLDIVVHVRAPAAGAGYAQIEGELLEALRRYGARAERKA